MEPLIVFSTCVGIALLAALDIQLAIGLWRKRSDMIKEMLLDMESAAIVLLSEWSEKAGGNE